MRPRILIPVAVLLASAAFVSPAGAKTRPPPVQGGGAFISGNGDPTATASDGTGSPEEGGGSGGGGGEQQCFWNVVIEDDLRFVIYEVDTVETQHSATGRWLAYSCAGTGGVNVNGNFLIPEGGLVDPAALAADALASIRIGAPAIRTSPSADGRLYVRIPTWLWLDQAWWQTFEATATAGRVTSTVTARPVVASWRTGDGGSVSCVGPGRAWQPGLSADATDCRHTYTRSSAGQPDGTFDLEATVTLEVSWSSNTGAGGTLPAISRASSVDVEVGEIQAIGTR